MSQWSLSLPKSLMDIILQICQKT